LINLSWSIDFIIFLFDADCETEADSLSVKIT